LLRRFVSFPPRASRHRKGYSLNETVRGCSRPDDKEAPSPESARDVETKYLNRCGAALFLAGSGRYGQGMILSLDEIEPTKMIDVDVHCCPDENSIS